MSYFNKSLLFSFLFCWATLCSGQQKFNSKEIISQTLDAILVCLKSNYKTSGATFAIISQLEWRHGVKECSFQKFMLCKTCYFRNSYRFTIRKTDLRRSGMLKSFGFVELFKDSSMQINGPLLYFSPIVYNDIDKTYLLEYISQDWGEYFYELILLEKVDGSLKIKEKIDSYITFD